MDGEKIGFIRLGFFVIVISCNVVYFFCFVRSIQGVANLKAKTFEYDTYNRKYES